ncbi:four helix bundle protein [Candidatus Peregrinibacteria bacterium]|nr:four helix bundle protein [Candidatus Peregrinibacteria bacterium]
MQSFVELEVWQVGLDLVKEIYRLTKKLPKDELFGLTSQMRRSSTSILTNLAEGFSRFTYPDKAAKYTIARGECGETKALLLICVALELLPPNDIREAQSRSESVGRMLSGLIRASKSRS